MLLTHQRHMATIRSAVAPAHTLLVYYVKAVEVWKISINFRKMQLLNTPAEGAIPPFVHQ